MTTTREVLIEARGLVARGWCQGNFARDAAGDRIDIRHHSACAWCTIGAIVASNGDVHVCDVLRPWTFAPDGWSLGQWNDAPERTQADVLAAFDRAIAACEGT